MQRLPAGALGVLVRLCYARTMSGSAKPSGCAAARSRRVRVVFGGNDPHDLTDRALLAPAESVPASSQADLVVAPAAAWPKVRARTYQG